ncbi:MAG: methionine biosynthesis protein MetW [Alphaproteobacteria bacterium]
MTQITPPTIRQDLQLIANMVQPGSRVLDIGCGDGALLAHLAETRNVDARGLELGQSNVNQCVGRGLSVVQGDADTDLADYPTAAFDHVILSQTLQAVHRPAHVLDEMLRIGRSAIVSFPNFGHWRVRWQLLSAGRMPVTGTLARPWYDTPNIHLCTIKDFAALAQDRHIKIEEAVTLNAASRPRALSGLSPLALRHANLFAAEAIFKLRRS